MGHPPPERDRDAVERDRQADQRDRDADERDRQADLRDRIADERDRQADDEDATDTHDGGDGGSPSNDDGWFGVDLGRQSERATPATPVEPEVDVPDTPAGNRKRSLTERLADAAADRERSRPADDDEGS